MVCFNTVATLRQNKKTYPLFTKRVSIIALQLAGMA